MSAVVLQGKLSCAKKGIAFCKSQIYSAATKFKATLTGSDNEECPTLEDGAENDDVVVDDSSGDCSEDEIAIEYKNVPSLGLGLGSPKSCLVICT